MTKCVECDETLTEEPFEGANGSAHCWDCHEAHLETAREDRDVVCAGDKY